MGEAQNLPFEDKEFDTVILAETLEHVPLEEAPQALAEAVRVGRKIIITVPKSTSYISPNHEHLWECTEEAMRKLLTPYSYDLRSSFCDNFWLAIVIA